VRQPRPHLALLVLRDDAALPPLLLELPLLVGERLGRPLHAAAVGSVDKVGAVAAAALHELRRGLGENPLAPAPEDAAPMAEHERDVEHPRALFSGVFEADPFVGAV